MGVDTKKPVATPLEVLNNWIGAVAGTCPACHEFSTGAWLVSSSTPRPGAVHACAYRVATAVSIVAP